MNPEEIAARLNDLGYQPLLETIKAIDPDLYKVIEAIGFIKNNSHGQVTVYIQDGKIVLIEPTWKIRTR